MTEPAKCPHGMPARIWVRPPEHDPHLGFSRSKCATEPPSAHDESEYMPKCLFADLLWLVERARSIRRAETAKTWTREEVARSWADWEREALSKTPSTL